MRPAALFAAACVVATTATTAFAQLPALPGPIDNMTGMVRGVPAAARPPGSVARAADWVNAIVAHQPGTADAAATTVTAWSTAEVRQLLIELETVRALFKNPRRTTFWLPYEIGMPPRTSINFTQTKLKYSDDDLTQLRNVVFLAQAQGLTEADLIARAVVLHSDIRFALDRPGPSLRHDDGRAGEYRDDTDHLQLARYLTERLRSSDGRDDDIRAWYRATLATLAGNQNWNAVHLQQALDRFGDDGELRFLGGCLHELMAAPRSQEPLRNLDLPPWIKFDVGSAREELGDAAGDLRRAVASLPAHAVARLHYGRVLVLAAKAREAVPELQRAAAGLGERDLQYFAQLFLGLAYENNGQPNEARTAYQAAAALVPVAQAPRLALSQLAAAAGDHRASAAEVARLLTLPAEEEERVDPWWGYLTTCGNGSDVLMADAVTRLSRPRQAPR